MMKITTMLNSKPAIRFFQLRCLSQLGVKSKEHVDERMQAWQIHAYGGVDELKLSNIRIPKLTRPSDILIKVDASSVNPIDVAIMHGYGSKVLNLMRKIKCCEGRSYSDIEFPLTMGRDFSGTVIARGHNVDRLKVGDEVWGVVPVEQQGCHADYIMLDNSLVNLRPANLSYIEAASILYAGLTAWSALWYTGGLCYKTNFPIQKNKKVLILGGSGGVGTLAIQLLKAWNMQVITTCSSDAVDMLQDLGADVVIDYKKNDADSNIISEGPYDIILDCCNQGPDVIKLKGYPHFNYITLNSPLLKNIDEYGFIFGNLKNVSDLLKYNIPIKEKTSLVKWGFFTPSSTGINTIQELVESKKIIPIVQHVYPFKELPKAYEKVKEGHLRGKVVIDMK